MKPRSLVLVYGLVSELADLVRCVFDSTWGLNLDTAVINMLAEYEARGGLRVTGRR